MMYFFKLLVYIGLNIPVHVLFLLFIAAIKHIIIIIKPTKIGTFNGKIKNKSI